jgi:hypothetical protein
MGEKAKIKNFFEKIRENAGGVAFTTAKCYNMGHNSASKQKKESIPYADIYPHHRRGYAPAAPLL